MCVRARSSCSGAAGLEPGTWGGEPSVAAGSGCSADTQVRVRKGSRSSQGRARWLRNPRSKGVTYTVRAGLVSIVLVLLSVRSPAVAAEKGTPACRHPALRDLVRSRFADRLDADE